MMMVTSETEREGESYFQSNDVTSGTESEEASYNEMMVMQLHLRLRVKKLVTM